MFTLSTLHFLSCYSYCCCLLGIASHASEKNLTCTFAASLYRLISGMNAMTNSGL